MVVASGGSWGGNWQCRSGGITVATVAPAHGADNVVPDKEDSGGPPLPHWGYPMWASKKKYICKIFSFRLLTFVLAACGHNLGRERLKIRAVSSPVSIGKIGQSSTWWGLFF